VATEAPDQTLAQAIKAKYPGQYDQWDDADLESAVKAKYPGTYDAWPTTEPKSSAAPKEPAKPDAGGGFLSELWNQINPMNMVHAAQHPIDTAHAVLQGQGELATRASQAFKQGDYGEAARLGVDYLLPIIGPQIARAQEMAQKGNYAGAAGASTGIGLGLSVPSRGASAVDPAGVAEAASEKTAQAMIPSRGANRMEALDVARRVAPELQEQGLTAFTQQGMSRNIDQAVADAGRGINQAQATVPKTVSFSVGDAVKKIAAKRDALISTGTGGQSVPTGYKMAVDAYNKAISELQDLGSTTNIDGMSNMRQGWQTAAADMRAYVKNPTKDITAQGASKAAAAWADSADAINDVVGAKAPQLNEANQQWSTVRNAQKVIHAAEDAEVLRKTGTTGGGTLTARMFDAVMASRLPTLTQAKVYAALSRALDNGDANAAAALTLSLGNAAGVDQSLTKQTADALRKVAGGQK
jgi:hypothetical protein